MNKQYRIYYNWYHENAMPGYEFETKVVMVTIDELIDALRLCKEQPNKYELISVERIPQ